MIDPSSLETGLRPVTTQNALTSSVSNQTTQSSRAKPELRSGQKVSDEEPTHQVTDPKSLLRAVESLEEELHTLGNYDVKISYNQEASRYVIAIVDAQTGEQIREIPPDEVLAIGRHLGDLRSLLFDSRD